jgi:hypothetical protein
MSWASFEIDIIDALTSQLVRSFDKLIESPLTTPILGALNEEQGVYQLFLNNKLIYVGKADNIPKRLDEHRFKITGRHTPLPFLMSFKCLYVHKNWTTLAPETSLISHYKGGATGSCEWNGNGFGPHDPGRNREITNKAPDGFDAVFPIKNNWPCPWIEPKNWNVLSLLVALKDTNKLPFLLRYETEHLGGDKFAHYTKGHPDHRTAFVNVPHRGMSVIELLELITKALPGWQATAFVSHLILYKEDRKYRHGNIIYYQPHPLP